MAVRRTITSFGVDVTLEYPDQLASTIEPLLPPGHVAADEGPDTHAVGLHHADGLHRLEVDGAVTLTAPDATVAVNGFDAQLRLLIALHAPDHVFVHAGCVAVDGSALLLPGRSFSGKSSMVAALVRAGAEYLSDEYAVLDPEGRVVPYPRPISVRGKGMVQDADVPASAFGAVAADRPHRVGGLAFLTYGPEATFTATELAAGEAALATLENTIPVRERPGACLASIAGAVRGARAIRGARGDATDAVDPLLHLLD